MGRVLSVFTMATGAMMPVGMLLFGPLADIVPIDTLLIVTGALTVPLCVPMMASRKLRAAGGLKKCGG
jgi:DHA3 family macrolide efflux protein-like MFS transporter